MNETSVTLVGNLVDDPRAADHRGRRGRGRIPGRLPPPGAGTGPPAGGRTADRCSSSVTCWRDLAGNAVASLRKGDPVVVTGRLSTRTYEKDGQTRSTCELEAVAIGPDLARGTAVFRRSPRPPAPRGRAGDGRRRGAGRRGEAAPALAGAGV